MSQLNSKEVLTEDDMFFCLGRKYSQDVFSVVEGTQ